MRLYCSLLLLCLSYSGHALGNSVNDLSNLMGHGVCQSGIWSEELSTTWWFNKRTDEDDLVMTPV